MRAISILVCFFYHIKDFLALNRTHWQCFNKSFNLVAAHLPSASYSSVKQLCVNLEIMKLIARSNLPFSLVDTEAFRDFVQYLDPRLILKSATTFIRYQLPLLYDNVKSASECILAEELPQCSGIATSTDIWISRNNYPYQSMTLH